MKGRINKYDSKTFIIYSVTTPHMLTMDENMTNLQDAETIFTIEDIKTLISTRRGDWRGYQKHDKNQSHGFNRYGCNISHIQKHI